MQKCWIEQLPGMPPIPPPPPGYSRPDRITATFIEKGYFIEYFEYPFDRDRLVALLYGPREFMFTTHPVFSRIQALDESCTANFSHRDIIHTLRNFPESKTHYKTIKAAYLQKIADRLTLAHLQDENERFRSVQDKQPWVIKMLPDSLLAGYLSVSPKRLKELRSQNK